MKNPLHLKFHQFIKDHGLESKKILVAVSCGLDSMGLLAHCIQIRKHVDLQLHIVHLHHGWRQESDEEYAFLEGYAKAHSIAFFGKKLHLNSADHDLENTARKGRYAFFKEIYDAIGAEGLFLAHHKQDLEETVVKRLYEGAHLMNLGGMKETSTYQGMTLYRPFLEVNKVDILAYVTENLVPYFEDATNHDLKFLRTRLRDQFFPYIEEIFGKKRGGCLVNLSHQAQLMSSYFEHKFDTEVLVTHPSSINQALYIPKSFHLFEIYNVLLVFLKRRDWVLSRDIHRGLCEAIHSSSHPKTFKVKDLIITGSIGFCSFISSDKVNLTINSTVEINKALWVYENKVPMPIKKLPAWFYKKVPVLRSEDKSFLNHYYSFINDHNYIRLI